jgi:hypothetical protein
MFNPEYDFYPISNKKNKLFGPDPLLPDLVAQLYFGKKLLESDKVKQHYNNIVSKSKTRFGIKIYRLPNLYLL